MFKKFNLLVLIGVLAAAFVFAAPANASSGDTDVICRSWRFCAFEDPGLEDVPVINLDDSGDDVSCRSLRFLCAFTAPDNADIQSCGYILRYCYATVPGNPTLSTIGGPLPHVATVYIN